MPAEARSIPGEILYHFVIKPQSVDELFNTLYERPSELSKQHFMAINSHLDQQVRPGQMVIVTPPDAQQCTPFEANLMDAARRIDQQLAAQSEEEAQVVAEYYGLLANVATYSGAGYGVAVNYFKQHKNQVEHVLNGIEKLYVDTYNRRKFSSEGFYRMRKLLFQQLDDVLKSMAGRARLGLDISRGNLKRSLGLSTKSLVHHLKDHPAPITELPGFEKNHAKVRNYAKVLKGAGYVALALDGVQSVAKVQQACTTGTEQECSKSKFGQSGRFVGSVAGGALAGRLAAHVACTVVFALPSVGTSLLWCGIVVGGVGGLVGGNFFGGGGKAISEVVYETTIQN